MVVLLDKLKVRVYKNKVYIFELFGRFLSCAVQVKGSFNFYDFEIKGFPKNHIKKICSSYEIPSHYTDLREAVVVNMINPDSQVYMFDSVREANDWLLRKQVFSALGD